MLHASHEITYIEHSCRVGQKFCLREGNRMYVLFARIRVQLLESSK